MSINAKKWEKVTRKGPPATLVKSSKSKNYVVCWKSNTNLYICSGLYCPKTCKTQQYQEHKNCCSAITTLEEMKQDRKFDEINVSSREHLPAPG